MSLGAAEVVGDCDIFTNSMSVSSNVAPAIAFELWLSPKRIAFRPIASSNS